MGCAQSKVDQEESVARCKERKLIMKDAVSARNAFAAAQTGYGVVLKNTGAALSDYAHDNKTGTGTGTGTSTTNPTPPPHLDPLLQPPPPPPPPPSLDTLPPPPPPLPNFSPSPIKRSISMPEIEVKPKQHEQPQQGLRDGKRVDSVAIVEEEEEEEEELNHGPRGRRRDNNNKNNNNDDNGVNVAVPPMPEAKNEAWDYFFMVDNMPGPSFEDDADVAMSDHGGHDFDNVGSGGGEIGEMGVEEVEPKTPVREEEQKIGGELEEKREEGGSDRTGKKGIDDLNVVTPEFRMVGGNKGGGGSMPSVDLMQVLSEIDDHFLKASESAQEVSKLLEATRLNYHANFADNRGNVPLLLDVGFFCSDFDCLVGCFALIIKKARIR